MKSRLTIISVVFVFILTSNLCVWSESPFVYRSEDRRDPFVALVSKDGKLMVAFGVLNSIDDVVVEGIIYDPGEGSIVIVNGLILGEGDKAGRIKVERIEKDRAILSYENKEYTFKLKE